MLAHLRAYAARKGLTINVRKSEVVAFNTSSYHPLPIPPPSFLYGGAAPSAHIWRADAQWSRTLLLSVKRVHQMVKHHGLKKHLNLSLRLFQTYALPSVFSHFSQVWATGLLSPSCPWTLE